MLENYFSSRGHFLASFLLLSFCFTRVFGQEYGDSQNVTSFDINVYLDSLYEAERIEDIELFLENRRNNKLFQQPVKLAATSSADPEQLELERQSLIAFYESTLGDEWINIPLDERWKQNGVFTEDMRNWHGVTLDIDGYVAWLDLGYDGYHYGHGLKGSIPQEIGNLKHLKRLDLAYNDLTGFVPSQINELTNLEIFDLSYNYELTGNIPSEIFSLTNLIELRIINGWTGWLPSIEIGNLINLEVLSVSGSEEFTGILPEVIGELDKLEMLSVRGITDDQFPSFVTQLSNLRYLELNGTFSGSIPDEICDLTHLWHLFLIGNFNGEIPDRIGNLTDLQELWLAGAPRGEVPPSFANLTKLYRLYLNQRYNSGDDLDREKLSGSILSYMKNMTKLRYVDIQGNQFTGSIPSEISSWTYLANFMIYDNLFSGGIPDEILNLDNLNYLGLHQNILSGSIPDGIINVARNWSSIHSNKFTFEDLTSKGLSVSSNVYYSPQDTIDDDKEFVVMIGDPIILSAEIDRNTTPPSKYQWFKDGIAVTTLSEENHTLSISSLTGEDIGEYYYIIKNDDAPALTLYSRIQKVTNRCPLVNYDFTSEPFVCTNYFLPTSDIHSCEEVSYAWDFGDGATSEKRDPYHAYSSPGTYDVSFIVEYLCDPVCGVQADTVIKQIVVSEISLELVETNIDVPSQHITEVLSASASTFADTWPIMHKEPVLESKNPYQNGTMGVWRNDASYVYNIERSFTDPVSIQDNGTFDLNTFNWGYADLDAIPNWLKVNTITNYSDFSFEIENQDILGNYTSAIYGYDGQLPSATGQNMQYEEMAFSGFEDVDGRTAGNWRLVTEQQPKKVLYQVHSGKGAVAVVKADMASLSLDNSWMVATRTSGLGRRLNLRRCEIVCMESFDENPEWTVVLFDQSLSSRAWGGIIWNVYGGITQERPDLDATVAHTGDASLRVTTDITQLQDQLKLIPGKEYLVSSWVSVNDQHLTAPVLADNIDLTITIKDENDVVVTTYDFSPEGPIIEGWQKLNGSFLYPLAAAKFELMLKAGSKGTAWYDDLRLHPLDGNMQTYVYEPETLRLKAVLDENNYASQYYYDQEGKLRIVKKETEKGIKTISESADHLVQYQE